MTSFSEFANSFQEKSRLRLEGISKLCEKTGNPQKGLNFIHIAGTNGKGSVCAFLQKIITLSGKKCGKFISPNMLDVCERISIDGKNISKEDMDRLLSVMEKCVSEIKEETGDCPTQFEIWTAAAFLYFTVRLLPSLIPSASSPFKKPSLQLSRESCSANCSIPMV